MKPMKLLLAFAMLMFFSIGTYAQIDDDDAQMFMISRGMKTNSYDFGVLSKLSSNDAYRVEHRFVVENKGTSQMQITDVVIPEGFGVVLVNSKIEPQQKSYIIVVLDSRFIKEKGAFSKSIILKTNQPGKEKISFNVKGKIQ